MVFSIDKRYLNPTFNIYFNYIILSLTISFLDYKMINKQKKKFLNWQLKYGIFD